MISDLLANKIDLAFKAVDAAKLQAYADKQMMPKCKETREALSAITRGLDMLEDLWCRVT